MDAVIHSSLYECQVMHHRLSPKKHRFVYNVFFFAIDLDELETLSKQLFWFNTKQAGFYRFLESDHLQLSEEPLKERVRSYLTEQGIQLGNGRVILLTNLRTLGYVFNPVSFYFCTDEAKQPLAAIAEVSNTFYEMKPFYIPLDKTHNGTFKAIYPKYFYVSPFSDLDLKFDFRLTMPDESLKIIINDVTDEAGEQPILLSSIVGKRLPLTDANILKLTFKYPLLTLKIIALIHWHAGLLFLKGLKFHLKESQIHLQKAVLNPHRSMLKQEKSDD
ncbi:MAG: DUF1365 domain-containing protein [Cyanobacteria bacterium]|nr:DUF1365 domain-containing protein [Cyanobacteriota bacterium]